MSSTPIYQPHRIATPVVLIGVAIVLYTLAIDVKQGLAGLLVAAMFGLTIAMGSALFAAINVVGGAKWWRPVASVCMTNARTLIVPAGLLVVVLAFGVKQLYPWATHEVVERGHHLLHHKATWFSTPFFLARAAIILGLWGLLVTTLAKRLNQTVKPARTGVFFLMIFSLTTALAFSDWTMSLEPEWFSTMYGVYGFAGSLQVGIAVTIIFALRKKDVGGKPLYDLGSLLFAFSCFWGYIWYCQAMLIWYAGMPEETFYFAHRLTGGWSALFWINPLINLVVPLIFLMSRHAKRSRMMLKQIAVVVVIGHFLDMLLLVGPAVSEAGTMLPWAALGATVAVAGGMLFWRQRIANAG